MKLPPRSRGAATAIGIFALSRIAVLAVASVMVLLREALGLRELASLWDGPFYLGIASSGYPQPGEPNAAIAFFPLYPLMIRLSSIVPGLSAVDTAIVLSTAGSAAGVVAVYALIREVSDDTAAARTAVLLSFFPAAYVLSMVYPDGLFILAAAISLLALLRRRWLLAGVAAAAATALRPNGLVLVACCAWAAIADIRETGSPRAAIAPLIAPLGAFAYLGFLWIRMGSPAAYLEVQEGTFGMRFDLGVSNARMLLELAKHPASVHGLAAVMAALVVSVTLYLLYRWRPPAVLTIYAVGIVAISLLSTNTTSILRFTMSAFPLLAAAARSMSPPVFASVVGVSGTLMGLSIFLVGTKFLNP